MWYSVAIVGRPNVGKSTLFNALIKDRQALVADLSGLTRDRQYGFADEEFGRVTYIDTPGIGLEDETIDAVCSQQTEYAMNEADAILFVVDARAGLLPVESVLAQKLRASNKPIIVVVNKSDGLQEDAVTGEFFQLGFETVLPTAASHRRGVNGLKETLFEKLHELEKPEFSEEADMERTTVTVIGRPNVGKSTLMNRMLKEERVVAHDMPGTTRDSIAADFEFNNVPYRLIDTAGIRRKSKIDPREDKGVEKNSIAQSFTSIERADVVIFLVDAQEGIVDQDLNLLSFLEQTGVGIIVAVNKWDGLEEDHKQQVKDKLQEKLVFLDYVPLMRISALHGTGVGELFKKVDKIKKQQYRSFSTAELTRILLEAVERHPPPIQRGRRIKLRYAHQGGHRPFSVVIHGNQVESLNSAYKRYIINQYRSALGGLEGFPIKLVLKAGENPYQHKRNKLTPRQMRSRRRMMRHVKKKK